MSHPLERNAVEFCVNISLAKYQFKLANKIESCTSSQHPVDFLIIVLLQTIWKIKLQ